MNHFRGTPANNFDLPERIDRLGRERDALLRGAAAELDAFGLRALIQRDAEFGARVLAHRARVAEDIEALRTGRKAARAYAETACG